MDFGFSEEQERLRESVRTFLAVECPPAFVRKTIESGTAHSAELWKKLGTRGWLGVLLPRDLGGLGGGFLDAAVLLEEAGRALLPGPFLSSAILATTLLLECASRPQRREILPRLAAGDAIVTLATAGLHPGDEAAGLRARRRGRDFVVDGTLSFVPDAASADWIVVAARAPAGKGGRGAGLSLLLVESAAPGVSVEALAGVDLTRPRYRVRLERVVVPGDRALGRVREAVVRRIAWTALGAIAVETVGVAQHALDAAVAYARQRTQFGRPIGRFQAVKHRCVDMLVALENARSLAYFAAWALHERSRATERAVAMAKACCGEAGTKVTADAIHVHGGVGFTWEHDLHLYYRRALANSAAFGTPPAHRETVARALGL